MTLEEHAAAPLAGGIAVHGHQCGMVWGAALAAGAQAYRLFGAGPRAEARAIVAAQRVVTAFQAQSGGRTDCIDITGIDQSSTTKEMMTYFLLKGGVVRCFRMAGRYAPLAWRELEAALSGPGQAPPVPASCAAVLARQMRASDLHTVMAAGLAGGIGLSGGACGALGAAIWLHGMDILGDGAQISFESPHAREAMARFTERTGGAFACTDIAGQTFAGVGDHAHYLRQGGCAALIEALAAQR